MPYLENGNWAWKNIRDSASMIQNTRKNLDFSQGSLSSSVIIIQWSVQHENSTLRNIHIFANKIYNENTEKKITILNAIRIL